MPAFCEQQIIEIEEGVMETPDLLPVNQKYRREPGACGWHLNWRQSCGTEPLTCGVCADSRWIMSEFQVIIGHPVGI